MGSTGRNLNETSGSRGFSIAGVEGYESESVKTAQQEINTRNIRSIDRKSFTAEGGGQWTMDIDGVGGIQILDETDSSRGGFGMGKAYGITVWDGSYNSQPQEIIYGSLNDAKRRAKEKLKELNI